jgi:hypothetical protein
MHKSATKCNETIGKWCKNKHGASKIIDTLETYQCDAETCMRTPSHVSATSVEPLEDSSEDDGSEVKRRDEGEGGLNAVVVPDTRPWVGDLSGDALPVRQGGRGGEKGQGRGWKP